MRVRLKGINRITRKLASGKSVTYHYAWKGGPRLEGEPGSPEFVASYNRAVTARRAPRNDLLISILDRFEQSTEFADLAERTRKDYRRLIKIIELEFGDFPLAAIEDRRTRGEFLAWRERRAIKSRRQADYAFAVLARILSWAHNRGLVPINPCERPGRLYRAARTKNVWTDADEKAFHAKAPIHLRFPVGAPLRAALDAARARCKKENKPLPATILATERGTAWTESGFRASWRKACIKSGVTDFTFHDLRGTAVTRLAIAGATVPEIAAITGHNLKEVGSILDAHYMHRDPALGVSAIQKLERRTISPN